MALPGAVVTIGGETALSHTTFPTGDCRIVFTADGWCRLIIRDVMLKDEADYTVRVVNEAGTCISTAYLTVLPATAGERTAKELIEQESLMTLETCRRSPRPHSLFALCLQRHFRFVSAQDI